MTWHLNGHSYCNQCVANEDSPVLSEDEQERATLDDSTDGYCRCCGRDLAGGDELEEVDCG